MLRGMLGQLLGGFKKRLLGLTYPVRKKLKLRMSHPPDCIRKFGARRFVDVECLIPSNQQAFLFLTGSGGRTDGVAMLLFKVGDRVERIGFLIPTWMKVDIITKVIPNKDGIEWACQYERVVPGLKMPG